MLKIILRTLALFALCVLLVYAPEIYTAVSAPYDLPQSERILLRVVLCTQDADSTDAFYDALTIYMKQFPTVHLRVTRADDQALFSLPAPQPDVFVLSARLAPPADDFVLPDGEESSSPFVSLTSDEGEPLLCGVHRDSLHKEAALSLLRCLKAAFAPAQGANSPQ